MYFMISMGLLLADIRAAWTLGFWKAMASSGSDMMVDTICTRGAGGSADELTVWDRTAKPFPSEVISRRTG